MMRIEESVHFKGDVTFTGGVTLPDGCVDKENVEAGAGLEATKQEHQHRAVYAQESDTTAAAEDRVLHVVKGAAGTLQDFKAGCVVANVGAAVVSVDLHKNGVTVLTAAIDIDSGDAAYALVAGVIDSADVVADDVLEVVVTVAAGGGTLGKGVFAYLDVHEDES